MGEIMKNNAAVQAAGCLALVLTTGCGGGGVLYGPPEATQVPSPPPPASSSPPGIPPSGQATGAPLQVTTIPLGKNNGVEARLADPGPRQHQAVPSVAGSADQRTSRGPVHVLHHGQGRRARGRRSRGGFWFDHRHGRRPPPEPRFPPGSSRTKTCSVSVKRRIRESYG